MREKISAFAIFIFFMIFIGLFSLFVYIFELDGDIDSIVISRRTKILGIETVKEVNSNFVEPEEITYIQPKLFTDEVENAIINYEDTNSEYSISIPRIGVENIVSQANSIEILEDEGWLVIPWSYEYQDSWLRFPPWKKREPKSEAIIVCYRRFFGENHPKSCYNLDKLSINDEIHFDESIYSIEHIRIINRPLDTIFQPNLEEQYLKIITNSGPNFEVDQNTNYLVLLAKKISDKDNTE